MTTMSVRPPARDRTRFDVYALVRASHGLTRTELVAATGLSRSTVNYAVARLVTDGLLSEIETEAKGPGSGSGRPGTRLRAVAGGSFVAGIDFGHGHVHVAVADALGRRLAEERTELNVDLDAEEAMNVATDILERLMRSNDISALGSVVAGVPGPLDAGTGLVRFPTILSSWAGLNPAQELGHRINAPVHVENDAVLGAIGEIHFGSGRKYDSFLYVKASHGVGASIVINGKPYRGATGLAGEIGHSHLPGRTELCRCGNRGCLEAVVSVDAVRNLIAHTHPDLPASSVSLTALPDPTSQRLLEDAGRTLGRALADLCTLLNPEAVIIGGELGTTGNAFLDGVRASLYRHTQPAVAASLEVTTATLGLDAELVGALELAANLETR